MVTERSASGLNFLLFLVGMAIVWKTTTGWVPLLGAFIASIHVSITSRVK